jgi:hypothetical protein
VQLLSSYWSIDFLDVHGILLKRGKQPLAVLQKNSVQIREIYRPIGRKKLKSKRESALTKNLQKLLVNSKAFGVKRLRNW